MTDHQLPHAAAGDTAVLVLAAGRGRRFDPTGNRWKLLQALPDGRIMIRAVCEAGLGAGPVTVVVSNEHVGAIRDALKGLDVRIEVCDRADEGMGATIKHGLRHTNPRTGWVIMLGDMPWVAADTISAVARAIGAGAALARPYFEGRPGHPVGISCQLRCEFLSLQDDEGGARIFKANADKVLRLATTDAGCVYDIDTPQHLSEYSGAQP